MEHKNSLTDLLAGILRREENSLLLIDLLSKIYDSKDISASFNYQMPNGTSQTISIPSYGYLISEIERISKNLENLAGIDVQSASIKLSDGTVRMIFGSELPLEYPEILQIDNPIYYKVKDKDQLIELEDKTKYVSINLSNKLKQGNQEVLVNKLILSIEDTDQIAYWDQIKNTNQNFDELISKLTDYNIIYQDIESVKSVSHKVPKFTGYFDVIRFYKRTIEFITNNNLNNKERLVYQLDKLTYQDNENRDIKLKVGDQLILNTDNIRNTIYKIDFIDESKNEIAFVLVQGTGFVSKGSNIFVIHPGFDESMKVDVPISKNQKLAVFLRPINPNGKVINSKLGSGVCFDTNELLFDDGTKLEDQFESRLADNLLSLQTDKRIPLEKGIQPNLPVLDLESFKVVAVNLHKKDAENLENLRKKTADKNNKKSEIEALETEISKLKSKLSNSSLTDQEIQNVNKSINESYDKKEGAVKEFVSLVQDILARKGEIVKFAPKYRIRGFWNIPESQFLDPINRKDEQQICQFEYRYRYNRTDGTSTELDSFKIKDENNKEQNATFSKWEFVKTNPMKKSLKNGDVVWENGDVKDPETLNSNQLDIAISYGESVEIQVRSISEVGFPTANLTSDWSNPINVPFPAELNDQFESSLQDMTNEQIKAEFFAEVRSLGLDVHIEDSFYINEKYFAHHADNIATEYRTPENRNKSVSQLLKEQDLKIEKLNAIINSEKGIISVNLLDENGNLIQKVTNNDSLSIFAGYYKELVSSLPIQKGGIVNKLFYVEIDNASAADLELLSYVPGSSVDVLPDQNTYEGYIINTDEYFKYRKYFDAPISLRGLTETNPDLIANRTKTNPYLELPGFSSKQSKGSFVHSRLYDLALSEAIYLDDQILIPNNTGATSASPFVWNETVTTGAAPNPNGILTNFCVHILHPDIQQNTYMMQNFTDYYVNKMPSRNNKSGLPIYPIFSNTKLSTIGVGNLNAEKQQSAIRYANSTAITSIKQFAPKLGFLKNDQYLIGKDTIGSYLFLAPNFHKDLYTGEIIYNKGKLLEKGNNNKVRIPVIFSSRFTDFYGAGSSGTGLLGGFGAPANLTNLTMAKKIGIDIPIKGQGIFSFDLRVEMQYQTK